MLAHLHKPAPVLALSVVRPVEVRVAVIPDIREVSVAIRVLPRRKVSDTIFATAA